MKAFLQSKFLSNPAASGKLKTASQKELFEKVDPAVDGPDCDHDCASCTVKYPAKFDIDTTAKLYGKVDEWATHVVVATGKTDWVRDIADEKGSVMRAIDKKASEPTNGVSDSVVHIRYRDQLLILGCSETKTIGLKYPCTGRISRC